MKQIGTENLILIQFIFEIEDNFTPDKIDVRLNLYGNHLYSSRLKESLKNMSIFP